MASQQEQLCLECGSTFRGRADKKFCSDQCRTTFNNRKKSEEHDYVRDINNILRKNRKILMGLNPERKNILVSRDKLRTQGFNFEYFTSTYITRDEKKRQYFYCYEQGYCAMEKDQCLLVIKKDFN